MGSTRTVAPLWLGLLGPLLGGCGEEFSPPGYGDYSIALELPARDDLDPAQDSRAGSLFVDVRAADGARSLELTDVAIAPTIAVAQGPVGDGIDVSVELRALGDGRAIGYGQARGVSVGEGGTITVPLRRRMLYACDGGGQSGGGHYALKVHDLADPATSEPATSLPLFEQLAGLQSPIGGYGTADGRRLVVAGNPPGVDSAVRVVVYSTSDHEQVGAVELPSVAWGFGPLGSGELALAAPYQGESQIYLVDIDALEVTTLSFSGGGEFTGTAVGASADGVTGLVVGHVTPSQGDPYGVLLAVDRTAASNGQSGALAMVSLQSPAYPMGVRATSDGATIVIAGYDDAEEGADGVVVVLDAASYEPLETIALEPGTSQVNALLLLADRYALVSRETQFRSSGQCCGGETVIDLASGSVLRSSDERSLLSGVVLPDGRVLAGQHDWFNDGEGNGPIVDLTDPQADPWPTVAIEGDFATSLVDLVSPFGTRL